MGKPSESDRKVLRKLYPACSSQLSQKRKFDPMAESVAEKNRAKKKAAIPRVGRARSITAILMKQPLSKVPKGNVRKQLANDGRIRKMQIRRSMTSSEIKQVIANCFCTLERAKEVKFMKCDQGNSLAVLKNQDLNGDQIAEAAGGGSLYLTEVRSLLCSSCVLSM